MRGYKHVKRPKGGAAASRRSWAAARNRGVCALSAAGSVCEASLVMQPICCNGGGGRAAQHGRDDDDGADGLRLEGSLLKLTHQDVPVASSTEKKLNIP